MMLVAAAMSGIVSFCMGFIAGAIWISRNPIDRDDDSDPERWSDFQ